jgi:hypothetical protein
MTTDLITTRHSSCHGGGKHVSVEPEQLAFLTTDTQQMVRDNCFYHHSSVRFSNGNAGGSVTIAVGPSVGKSEDEFLRRKRTEHNNQNHNTKSLTHTTSFKQQKQSSQILSKVSTSDHTQQQQKRSERMR